MSGTASDQGRILLQQAMELRDRVRANLESGRYQNDDVQMEAYNDLGRTAVTLFPTDPIIRELELLPDKLLREQTRWMVVGSSDQVSKRLDSHLTRLINRLQVILGEPSLPSEQS